MTMKTNSWMWLVKFKKFSQPVSENTGTHQDAVFYYSMKLFLSITYSIIKHNILSSNSATSHTHSQMENLAIPS